jgi:hypothetical protein
VEHLFRHLLLYPKVGSSFSERKFRGKERWWIGIEMPKLINAFSSIGLRTFNTKDKAFWPLMIIKIGQ